MHIPKSSEIQPSLISCTHWDLVVTQIESPTEGHCHDGSLTQGKKISFNDLLDIDDIIFDDDPRLADARIPAVHGSDKHSVAYLTAETDPIFIAWISATPPLYPGGWYDTTQNLIALSGFNDDLNYEVPLTFGAGLTRTENTINCDITQYTDSDAVAAIKDDADWHATNWDTAYGWGDHATEGYLKVESDPVFSAWDKSTGISITENQISDLQAYLLAGDNVSSLTNDAGYLTTWTLDQAFDAGKEIDGADSEANALQIGETTDKILLWHDGSNAHFKSNAGDLLAETDWEIYKDSPVVRLRSLDDSDYYGELYRLATGEFGLRGQVYKPGATGNAATSVVNSAIISIANPGDFLTTTFTNCLWVYNNGNDVNYGSLFVYVTTRLEVICALYQQNLYVYLNPNWIDTGFDITNGNWGCVIAWYDGIKFYLDVNNSGSPYSITRTISGTTTALRFYAYPAGSSAKAKIDEPQLYNSVLTADQRAEYYALGAGLYGAVTGATPEGGWHMDETTGVCVDFTGNGHTGTLTNVTYTTGKVNIPGAVELKRAINIRDGVAASEEYIIDIGDRDYNTVASIYAYGDLYLEAHNLITDTTTGMQIASAADQKIGFFGATPVAQRAKADYNNWANFSDIVSALVDIGIFDAV